MLVSRYTNDEREENVFQCTTYRDHDCRTPVNDVHRTRVFVVVLVRYSLSKRGVCVRVLSHCIIVVFTLRSYGILEYWYYPITANIIVIGRWQSGEN